MNLKVAVTIAIKDLLDAVRNYLLLAILLMPIGFSLLFGLLYRDTPSGAAIVVYDPGESKIVKSIGSSNGWDAWVVNSEADVEPTLTEKSALAGVVLPADFDARLVAGERPSLKMILNGSQDRRLTAQRLIVDLVIAQSGQPLPVDLTVSTINVSQAGGESASTPASDSALRNLPIQGYFLVTWSMMGIAMVGMYMVPTLLVEEKERKTLDALLVAPVSYVDLIVGKALVGIVYALLSAGMVFVLNQAVPLHSIGALIAVGIPGALFATLIGLWFGGLVNNTQSLNSWSSIPLLAFLLPVILIGIPSNPLSSILQFFPPTHLMEGITRAITGELPDRIWVNVLVLVISCGLAGILVWLSLRRREQA
jgi:ABC-2 type transport system permease protein